MSVRDPDKQYTITGAEPLFDVQGIPQDGIHLVGRGLFRSDAAGDDLAYLEVNGDTDDNNYERAFNTNGFAGIGVHDDVAEVSTIQGTPSSSGLYTVIHFMIPYYADADMHVMLYRTELGDEKGLASTGWQTWRYFVPGPIGNLQWRLQDGQFIDSRLMLWRQ
jgi:hypothetical protein